MKCTVSLLIDNSPVVYEILHEMDGIYIALLTSKSIYANLPSLPTKVIIIKAADGWKTDIDYSILSERLISEAVAMSRALE